MLAALRSVTFVIGGPAIGSCSRENTLLLFAITMGSVMVIVANPAAPPQSIQESDRPGEFLILPAKKLRGGLPGAVFFPLEQQCTRFGHVAS